MPEIKFRFWSIQDQEMISGDVINSDHAYRYLTNNNNRSYIIPMQYTGLYETFEGDVLGIDRVGGDTEILGSIIYDPDVAAFVVKQSNGGWEYLMNFFLKYTTAYVVGNIHEHPFLIKP
jgi:hypothetical protein